MGTVALFAKKTDGTTISLSGEFALQDIQILIRFLDYLERANKCTLIARGFPTQTKINYEQATGLTVTGADIPDSELFELLHVLRPLILKNEPASFHHVAAILNKAFRSKDLSAHLKKQRQIFEHGELSQYMQIELGESPLLNESVLTTWLNAEQYHTDTEKVAAWKDMESTFGPLNFRPLLMAHLRSKVVALHALKDLASVVVKEHEV